MSVIQNIGTEQAPFVANKMAKAPELPSPQAKAGSPSFSSRNQEYVVNLSGEAVDVANLQESKNGLNDTAKSIRIADESMQKINEYVDQMKANLTAIVKQYPPYPPGSEERVSFLRSFNAFRQLIDRLSFNTSDKGTAKIISGLNGKINEGAGVSEEGNS